MFANQLKYLRQSQELSQVQLAQKLGVTKQTVSNWENDNIMPSVEMIIRIADYFHVSTDYLLDRKIFRSDDKSIINTTGLSQKQVEHICLIIEDLRNR